MIRLSARDRANQAEFSYGHLAVIMSCLATGAIAVVISFLLSRETDIRSTQRTEQAYREAIRLSEQQACDMWITIDDAYQGAPASSSERGLSIQKKIHEYRVRLNCPQDAGKKKD